MHTLCKVSSDYLLINIVSLGLCIMPEICFWYSHLEHLLWQNWSRTLNSETESLHSIPGLSLKTGFMKHMPMASVYLCTIIQGLGSDHHVVLKLFHVVLFLICGAGNWTQGSHRLGKYSTLELYPALESCFLSFMVSQFVSGNMTEAIAQQGLEKAASPQGARHEETTFSLCLNPQS